MTYTRHQHLHRIFYWSHLHISSKLLKCFLDLPPTSTSPFAHGSHGCFLAANVTTIPMITMVVPVAASWTNWVVVSLRQKRIQTLKTLLTFLNLWRLRDHLDVTQLALVAQIHLFSWRRIVTSCTCQNHNNFTKKKMKSWAKIHWTQTKEKYSSPWHRLCFPSLDTKLGQGEIPFIFFAKNG